MSAQEQLDQPPTPAYQQLIVNRTVQALTRRDILPALPAPPNSPAQNSQALFVGAVCAIVGERLIELGDFTPNTQPTPDDIPLITEIINEEITATARVAKPLLQYLEKRTPHALQSLTQTLFQDQTQYATYQQGPVETTDGRILYPPSVPLSATPVVTSALGNLLLSDPPFDSSLVEILVRSDDKRAHYAVERRISIPLPLEDHPDPIEQEFEIKKKWISDFIYAAIFFSEPAPDSPYMKRFTNLLVDMYPDGEYFQALQVRGDSRYIEALAYFRTEFGLICIDNARFLPLRRAAYFFLTRDNGNSPVSFPRLLQAVQGNLTLYEPEIPNIIAHHYPNIGKASPAAELINHQERKEVEPSRHFNNAVQEFVKHDISSDNTNHERAANTIPLLMITERDQSSVEFLYDLIKNPQTNILVRDAAIHRLFGIAKQDDLSVATKARLIGEALAMGLVFLGKDQSMRDIGLALAGLSGPLLAHPEILSQIGSHNVEAIENFSTTLENMKVLPVGYDHSLINNVVAAIHSAQQKKFRRP